MYVSPVCNGHFWADEADIFVGLSEKRPAYEPKIATRKEETAYPLAPRFPRVFYLLQRNAGWTLMADDTESEIRGGNGR